MIKKLATLFGVSLLAAACAQPGEALNLEEPDTIVEAQTQEVVDTSAIQAGSLQDFIANIGDTVYFDYNQSDLTENAIEALSFQADWLLEYDSYGITVSGHADERGTREYNLALGEARASSVRDFFVQSGISEDRLEIVSYGEEQPAVTGSDEYAWSKNRRSQTILR